jgi:hypothetical protein
MLVTEDGERPAKPESVLYIGPESSIRRYTVLTLRNDGYTVHVGNDDIVGGEMLARDQSRLIVLDQHGVARWTDTVNVLRRINRSVPILVLVKHSETRSKGRIIPPQTSTLSLCRISIDHQELIRVVGDLVRHTDTHRVVVGRSGTCSDRRT